MAHDHLGGWFSTVRGRRGFAVCSDEVHPGVEMVGIEVGTNPCLPVSSSSPQPFPCFKSFYTSSRA
jgi:hypothetical protein